jgi:hypothetical protein
MRPSTMSVRIGSQTVYVSEPSRKSATGPTMRGCLLIQSRSACACTGGWYAVRRRVRGGGAPLAVCERTLIHAWGYTRGPRGRLEVEPVQDVACDGGGAQVREGDGRGAGHARGRRRRGRGHVELRDAAVRAQERVEGLLGHVRPVERDAQDRGRVPVHVLRGVSGPGGGPPSKVRVYLAPGSALDEPKRAAAEAGPARDAAAALDVRAQRVLGVLPGRVRGVLARAERDVVADVHEHAAVLRVRLEPDEREARRRAEHGRQLREERVLPEEAEVVSEAARGQ